MRAAVFALAVLSLFAGACSSSSPQSAASESETTVSADGRSGPEPTRSEPVGDVVPVAGEPCSYLSKDEVASFVGQPIDALTVTGESCIWSFRPLTSGTFAGERPNLRLGVLGGSEEFDALKSGATTEVSDLGDDAFVRERDGVGGGETYVLEGNTTIVVVYQLVFEEANDQFLSQQRVAELVLSRL